MIGPDAMYSARSIDRRRSWVWAHRVAAERDGWRLEALRHHLERSEERPGTMPDPELLDRSRSIRGRLEFIIGTIVGLAVLFVWMLLFKPSGRLRPGARRIIAVHGEVSTRTRHVLGAISKADPPVDGIVLLGRLRHSPKVVARIWADAGYKSLPSPCVPFSMRAGFAAVQDIPKLLREGWRAAGSGLGALGWREWTGICFRAVHGAIIARWWKTQRVASDAEVIFGITGTIDTVLFERAIRTARGRSIHAVHGQSVGPIFLGFSDLALFRSHYDAKQMDACGAYGRCSIQAAPPVMTQRGRRGLLLLSNLAHPMNPDFRCEGPIHEIAVLSSVAAAAQNLGDEAVPLIWKPHPVFYSLPEADAIPVQARADVLGFSELPISTSLTEAAASARWVVSTPSTVALDLLQAGILTVVVDPRESLLDTAVALLPRAPSEPEGLVRALTALSDEAAYRKQIRSAMDRIGPAQPLKMTSLLV